jgi:hypothetical protein
MSTQQKPTAVVLRHDSNIRLNVTHRGSFLLRDFKLGEDFRHWGPTNKYFSFGQCLEIMSQQIPFRFTLDVQAASVLFTIYSKRNKFSENQFKSLYNLFMRYIPPAQLNRLDQYIPEPFKSIGELVDKLDRLANGDKYQDAVPGVDDTKHFSGRNLENIVNMADNMRSKVRGKYDNAYKKADREKPFIENAKGVESRKPTRDPFTLEDGTLGGFTGLVNAINKGIASISGMDEDRLNASELEGLPKTNRNKKRLNPADLEGKMHIEGVPQERPPQEGFMDEEDDSDSEAESILKGIAKLTL